MQLKTCPTCHARYPLEFEVCPADGVRLEAESGVDEARTGWPTGKVVGGKYRISSRLGEDEVADIYEAHTMSLSAPRVIRVLQPDFAADARASEEFRKTADLLQKAAQANVIAVEGRGNAEDGRPFLVTEFFQGQPLSELMRAEGPLEPQRACSITRQVALALSAAHRLGLLHLSLNPSNILVSGAPGEENVKVQGFGSVYVRARWMRNGGSRSEVTLRDYLQGDLRYSSPELVLGTPPQLLDERADLYSLGVVLCQMLTGRLPFAGGDPGPDLGGRTGLEPELTALAARIEGLPATMGSGHGGMKVPEPLAAIVMTLLERREELRLPTAQDLIEQMALAQSRMASLVKPSLAEPRESMLPRDSAEVAPVRTQVGEPVEIGGRRLGPELESAAASPAASGAAPDALDLTARTSGVSAPRPVVVPTPEAAGASRALTVESRQSRDDTSILFKTDHPRSPSRVGRWALAAVAVLVLAAGAWFFITRARTQWLGAGPLSPIKSDELRSVEGVNSTSSPPSQATSQPVKQPQTSTTSASQLTQPHQQPVTTPPGGAPSPGENVSQQGSLNGPKSGAAQTGATAPAPGSGNTSTRSRPATTPASASSGAAPSVSPEDVAAQVKRAIAAGDVFFELGQYDYAIRAYQGPLKYDPKNLELKLKIERAQKAKAAEEQYLGQ